MSADLENRGGACLRIVEEFVRQKTGGISEQRGSTIAASSTEPTTYLHAGDIDKNYGKRRFEVLVAQICGSASYNLAVASSDVDYFGVYACDLRDLFRLKGPIMTLDTHKPMDICCYELSHYCQLLRKGNPKLVEPIFLSKGEIYRHSYWDRLRSIGTPSVLTKSVLNSYLAFAYSQLGDGQKKGADGKTTKRLYHALRLVYEARRIFSAQPPNVYLEGEEQQYIMSVRLGHEDPDKAEAMVRALLAELDGKANTQIGRASCRERGEIS